MGGKLSSEGMPWLKGQGYPAPEGYCNEGTKLIFRNNFSREAENLDSYLNYSDFSKFQIKASIGLVHTNL